MNTNENQVRVIFRTWNARHGGGVIALFPDLIDNGLHGRIESFEHLGQHGGADYGFVIANSRPAAPDKYAALKRELEAPPYEYNLLVRQRRNGRTKRSDWAVRSAVMAAASRELCIRASSELSSAWIRPKGYTDADLEKS